MPKHTFPEIVALYEADPHPYHAGLLLQAALAQQRRAQLPASNIIPFVERVTMRLLQLGHASKPFEPKRYRRKY